MTKDHGPSVKDDEKYEALREDGHSKEAAARIANAGDQASEKGGHAPLLRRLDRRRPARTGRGARRRGSLRHDQGRADRGAALALIPLCGPRGKVRGVPCVATCDATDPRASPCPRAPWSHQLTRLDPDATDASPSSEADASSRAPAPRGGREAPVPTLAPLRVPAYRRIWGAAVVSHLGTFLQMTAAPWLMLELTGSAFLVSLVTSFLLLPRLLLTLPAGALADVVDRRTLLLAGNLVARRGRGRDGDRVGPGPDDAGVAARADAAARQRHRDLDARVPDPCPGPRAATAAAAGHHPELGRVQRRPRRRPGHRRRARRRGVGRRLVRPERRVVPAGVRGPADPAAGPGRTRRRVPPPPAARHGRRGPLRAVHPRRSCASSPSPRGSR